MSKSMNESLAASQPPNGDTDQGPPNGYKDYSDSEKQPLASHGQEHKPGITFAGQEKLPKLPIPDLENTCKNYLAALKPLQSHREHEETAAAVQEFLKSEGPELQEKLKKYATGKSSYIEQFCMFLCIANNKQQYQRVETDALCRVRFISKLR